MRAKFISSGSEKGSEAMKSMEEAYKSERKFAIIDPLNAQSKLDKLSALIVDLSKLSEVDKNVSNAKNTVEFIPSKNYFAKLL